MCTSYPFILVRKQTPKHVTALSPLLSGLFSDRHKFLHFLLFSIQGVEAIVKSTCMACTEPWVPSPESLGSQTSREPGVTSGSLREGFWSVQRATCNQATWHWGRRRGDGKMLMSPKPHSHKCHLIKTVKPRNHFLNKHPSWISNLLKFWNALLPNRDELLHNSQHPESG
jgi:hypothetical protein